MYRQTYASRLWRVLLAVTAVGCCVVLGCSNRDRVTAIHPKANLLPYAANVTEVVSAQSRSESDKVGLNSALEAPVVTIGVKEGPRELMLGEIKGVAHFANADTVFVLDGQYNEIRMYDTMGNYIKTIGRPGAGPGELSYPEDILTFLDDRFLEKIVVTGRKRRVQFFESRGDSYMQSSEFALDFTPEDACVIGKRIYLYGATPKGSTGVFHVYSMGGKHIKSFGASYQSENKQVKSMISGRGHMACDRTAKMIIFAFSDSDLIYGYDLAGHLQWVSSVEPFQSHPIEQGTSDQGTVELKFRTIDGGDRLVNIVDVPGSGVVVQRMHTISKGSPLSNPRRSVHSYWVSSLSGQGKHIFEENAAIMDVSRKWFLAARNTPYPRLEVYNVEDVKWDAIGTDKRRMSQ